MVVPGDRVVVSQCPRNMDSGVMQETGVVKLITVDENYTCGAYVFGAERGSGAVFDARTASCVDMRAGGGGVQGRPMYVIGSDPNLEGMVRQESSAKGPAPAPCVAKH